MVVKKFKKTLFGGLFFGLAAMLIVTLPALAVETKMDKQLEPGNWNELAELDKRCACQRR